MSALNVPELSLVCLIGVSGSGKSTFAAEHFGRFEVISSDFCRGLVADDENDQSATQAAFEVLHTIAGKRLAAGRLTVVDATSVQREARAQLVALARAHDVLPVAIVFDLPERVCVERNEARRGPDLRPGGRPPAARPAPPRDCAACRRRVSAPSTSCAPSRRSPTRRSSGRSCSPTTATRTARST